MALVVKCDVCNCVPGIDENHALITLVGMSTYRKQRVWHLCPSCFHAVHRLLDEMYKKARGFV